MVFGASWPHEAPPRLLSYVIRGVPRPWRVKVDQSFLPEPLFIAVVGGFGESLVHLRVCIISLINRRVAAPPPVLCFCFYMISVYNNVRSAQQL